MAEPKVTDKELERYRTLLDMPTEFKDGFGWTTVAGIFFCGLIMMPGGIYLSMMTGNQIGMAGQWVTVILFMEVARRAMRPLSKQHLVVLLHAAFVMMAANAIFPGGPFGHIVFRAYLVGSDAARDAGMLGLFPSWFAPPHDSEAVLRRDLFHEEWLVPIVILLVVILISMVKRYTLGYVIFRMTSDVERLPFPLAPISAQGAMALAEADENVEALRVEKEKEKGEPQPESATATFQENDPHKKKKKSERWRLFSLGAYIGIAFGFIQVGIPALTSLFLAQPFYLIPQPFIDTTTATESFLPATPTGVALDAAVLFMGFVLPFWSVIGTFIAILLTLIMNPILHHYGVLQTWQPGMDTVNTTFSNNIDFWLSFSLGAAFGIAAVSVWSMVRDLRAKQAELMKKESARQARQDVWAPPREGRGDYPMWIAVVLYVAVSVVLIGMALMLLGFSWNIFFFLIFFSFLFTPFISYVNGRLLGIAGQNVEIPNVREIAFIASGAKGIDIWLAPMPIDNFGNMAQQYRVNELTGVSFWSLIKADLVAVPVLFVLSMGFWAFIWKADPVPSAFFPAAQVNWELQAKNSVLMYSSTLTDEEGNRRPFEETELGKALKWPVVTAGFGTMTILFTVLSALGLPVMLVYGLMRGLGSLPHYMILEVVGAFLSRFYLQKKFGEKNFLRMAPTLLAGYMTGVGLIGMATMALRLIASAISTAPF